LILITAETFGIGITGSTITSFTGSSSSSSSSTGTFGGSSSSSRTDYKRGQTFIFCFFFFIIKIYTSILFEHFHISPCPFRLNTNSERGEILLNQSLGYLSYVVDFFDVFCWSDGVEF
jgi:hypothetical protein